MYYSAAPQVSRVQVRIDGEPEQTWFDGAPAPYISAWHAALRPGDAVGPPPAIRLIGHWKDRGVLALWAFGAQLVDCAVFVRREA